VTELRHSCPGVDPGAAGALVGVLRHNDWIMSALQAVARSGLPDALPPPGRPGWRQAISGRATLAS